MTSASGSVLTPQKKSEASSVEKPARTSVLDGIPMSMPSLALADKLLGRAEKVGVRPPEAAGQAEQAAGATAAAAAAASAAPSDEEALGDLLLGIVASARAQGLDPERALRERLRALRGEITTAEADARA